MVILFWNTKGNKNINSVINALIKEHSVDLVALAEYEADIDDLIYRLTPLLFVKCVTLGCKRIKIITRLSDVEPYRQNKYFSVQKRGDIWMCFIHAPSKLHCDNSAISSTIRKCVEDIYLDCDDKDKVLIAGDFNQDPYEEGMMSINGVLSQMSFGKKEKNFKTMYGYNYRKFYNPMWNLFGDFNKPCGSYYKNANNGYYQNWHIFDQVIISKNLIKYFNSETLKFLTRAGEISLVRRSGIPDDRISDHLPLIFEIKEK